MRSLLRFFSLTFAFTWICWAASRAISYGSTPVLLLGVFAPGLVALALTERYEGRAATRALIARIFKWDVGARWYAFAILYIPAIKLVVALVHRIVTDAWPRFGQEPVYAMAAALLVSTWIQAGEEVGWRGYALPRLSERFGLAQASVILGGIWATWHLPIFFFPVGDLLGQSFPLYLLQVTAISVTMAWLYWRTGGSLLIVMLFHAAVNNLKDIVPSATPGATNPFVFNASLVGWLTVAFLWIAAAYFLFKMRGVTALPSAVVGTGDREPFRIQD
jgi:membrane protease YdiL (CAAX protease family)